MSEISKKKQARVVLTRDLLDKRMVRFSQIHTWGLTLLPLLGTGVALFVSFQVGIGVLEIALFLSMYFLSLIGITVGFHRYFSHGAFQTSPIIRILLGILGSMSAQGPLIYWVSNHRRHHQYSDLAKDPHSPYVNSEQSLGRIQGLWHAHIGWMFRHELTNSFLFSKDLLKDSAIAKINQLYLWWVFLGLALPTFLGGIIAGTWMGALSGFLWGGLVRIFLSSHMAFSINSICHCYGRSSFKTKENSRNHFWLAIPTLGESWHNNHHAFPSSAKFGLKLWQIDLGYWVIFCLKTFHCIWNVKAPNPEIIAKKEKLD